MGKNNKKCLGRPKNCDNEPGKGACKKKKKSNSQDCKNCTAV